MEAETCKSPSIYHVISRRCNADKRLKNHTHTIRDLCKSDLLALTPDIQVQSFLVGLVTVIIIGQILKKKKKVCGIGKQPPKEGWKSIPSDPVEFQSDS